MKQIGNDIRMIFASWILVLVMKIVPKDKHGIIVLKAILAAFQEIQNDMTKKESDGTR